MVQRQIKGSPRNMKKGTIRYEIIFLRGKPNPLSGSGGPDKDPG